jgi:GntR family transcriptional regulator
MFVTDGARQQLLKDERQRFLNKAWPEVIATIRRLGLDIDTLLKAVPEPGDQGEKE